MISRPYKPLPCDPSVTRALLLALDAGNYNAAPSTLRQGSLHLVMRDENGGFREPTGAEYEAAYAKIEAERKWEAIAALDLP